jgi:NADH-quinone oxidoreductase subunit N
VTPDITLSSVLALAPEIGLTLLIMVVLFYDRLLQPEDRRQLGLFTAWGGVAILLVTLGLWFYLNEPGAGAVSIWGGMLQHDLVTLVFRVMFLVALVLTSLISADVPRLQRGEYYVLLMSSTLGFSLMAAASDLIMLFVAIETASISLYLLAGFTTNSSRSVEAGMKYFVYGSFASAVMLYGFSLLYGLSGQTNIYAIAQMIVGQQVDTAVLLAAVLVVVGFGFKVSAVPFHFWTPDVYEGAPSPVTAFLSTASKAAGFAVLTRVFVAGTVGQAHPGQEWWNMLVAMCVVTMILGNFLAIFQTNIKRLLAYSSIAQAGFALIGLVSLTPEGSAATMFYLLMYVVTNIAAFTVIILVSNMTGSDELKDFYGLSRRSPWLGLAMLLALLSLGGIPPTAGFFAKFFIFRAAVEAGLWWLALIGILNAFVALYYYLSVVKYIYLFRSEEDEIAIPVPRAYQVALALATFGIIYLGVMPNATMEWARQAALAFFTG